MKIEQHDQLFTCEACKNTFRAVLTTKEAEDEAEKLFGVKDASENPNMAIVCDDCFNKIIPQHIRDKKGPT